MFVQFVLKNIWDVYSAVNNKYSQATPPAPLPSVISHQG